MIFDKLEKVPLKFSGVVRKNSLRIVKRFMKGYSSPQAVAKDAGVSVRTVYRVIEDARSVGFRVRKKHGRFHFIV